MGYHIFQKSWQYSKNLWSTVKKGVVKIHKNPSDVLIERRKDFEEIKKKLEKMEPIWILVFNIYGYLRAQEIRKKEGETIVLMGKHEKARQRVHKYFDPLNAHNIKADTRYSIKGLDGGLIELKHIRTATSLICDPSRKQFTDVDKERENDNETKQESVVAGRKHIHRSTLLICHPSNQPFNDGDTEWISQNGNEKHLRELYNNRLLVFTDCNCNCVRHRKVPEAIQHICTGSIILHGLDGKVSGVKLFILKNIGRIQYVELLTDCVYFLQIFLLL